MRDNLLFFNIHEKENTTEIIHDLLEQKIEIVQIEDGRKHVKIYQSHRIGRFLLLIITAYSNLITLSYSYRQRVAGFSVRGGRENPRRAKEFSLRFILYGDVLMFPTLKACKFTYN
jgi:hypothetical protein